MAETAAQGSLAAIVALLILREVFAYLSKRKEANGARRTTDKVNDLRMQLEGVISRLDRIIERLDDMALATKAARRQTEIATEQTERMVRAVSQLEKTFNDAGLHRRTHDTAPGV